MTESIEAKLTRKAELEDQISTARAELKSLNSEIAEWEIARSMENSVTGPTDGALRVVSDGIASGESVQMP